MNSMYSELVEMSAGVEVSECMLGGLGRLGSAREVVLSGRISNMVRGFSLVVSSTTRAKFRTDCGRLVDLRREFPGGLERGVWFLRSAFGAREEQEWVQIVGPGERVDVAMGVRFRRKYYVSTISIPHGESV